MNNADVVAKVAQLAGIDKDICQKVLSTLEKVMADELAASKGAGGALDNITSVLNLFNKKGG